MWPIEPDAFESFVSAPAGAETDDALYFTFTGERIVCVSEAGIPRAVTRDEFRWFDVEVSFKHYLGRWEGRSCYALVIDGTVPEGFATVGLRDWLERVDSAFFYLAGRAKQIVDWHRTHRFCGRCGAATRNHRVDRAKECPRCGLLSYPRLSPSIIVLVRKGDEMLLARNARWRHGTYSTIAGFVEPGESIEQAVHREVFEEVGLAGVRAALHGQSTVAVPQLADAWLPRGLRRRRYRLPGGRDRRGTVVPLRRAPEHANAQGDLRMAYRRFRQGKERGQRSSRPVEDTPRGDFARCPPGRPSAT